MVTRQDPVNTYVEHSTSPAQNGPPLPRWLPLVQTEDIRLEPDLYEACKSDIKNYCSAVQYGNAQVTLLFSNCKSYVKVTF